MRSLETKKADHISWVRMPDRMSESVNLSRDGCTQSMEPNARTEL